MGALGWTRDCSLAFEGANGIVCGAPSQRPWLASEEWAVLLKVLLLRMGSPM